jgi:putative ABC transport system ATP-binding protein
MLDVIQVTKRYRSGRGRMTALNGVRLQAAAGQSLAIAGRSGSGKTTLLHCIAGLEVPDEGRVVFRGRDISRLSRRDRQQFLRTEIGIVFQSGNLLAYLTVHDNIAFPLRLAGRPQKEIQQRVARLLAWIGLPQAGGALPHELSGGELQRAAVARAIAHRPHLVLADEPTASLDTTTAAAVIELLIDFSRRDETLVLMATHDPAVLAAADRALFLVDGKVTSPASAPPR